MQKEQDISNSNGGSAKKATHVAPSHYVAIGASAGGLEAVEAFFSNMSANSGLAFVVIQHLSPDYKSLMVEILSKRTEMPVRRAEEGMQVEANTVYLNSPKKNLTIFHGKLLQVEQDHSRGINLPIDVFLRSLADDQGEKAVGVILSGTGSDGTRGIRVIKESGGMVMVQDEESAKFDGMPRSAISTGLADFVLPPDEMPGQLMSYTKHPYVAKSERSDSLLTDEDGLTRIFSLLREKTKVDFTYYKPSTVVRRIERRMSVNQIHDLRDYVRFMESYPREVTSLYRELLIGVTSFFRDRDAFEILEEKLLPSLFANLANNEIRFWVAGCSSGEEAYSIAMVSQECMARLGKSIDVKIFATDVDHDVILQAGNGVFPESIAADLNPKYLSKYFQKKDDCFQISRNLREMVVFAQHNLIKDPPFTKIDLVSCRNLLIYLQPVLQKKALEMFNFSLNPGGYLFLGSSETTGDMSDFFEPLHHKWKIYRSRGKRKLAGLNHEVTPYDVRDRLSSMRVARAGHVLRSYEEERILERFLQGLAGDYIPLAIVVNDQMELLHVIGDSTGFFKVPAGKIHNEVSRMAVKELAIPLATGIQKVFKKGEEHRFTNIRIPNGESTKVVNMRIKMLPEKKGQEPLVAVFFDEETVKSEKRSDKDEQTSYDIGKVAEQRIIDLEQELQFSRENLQATIEELETSNEELQATNEELLASNEELQSTNEELQSVNEELFTVNAEYQRKIMELTELSNDMENLLNSTQIGTIFLDENLEIRKITPIVSALFKVTEHDVGRPFSFLVHNLVDVDPLKEVVRVQKRGKPNDVEVLDKSGNWFLMRILPYQIGPRTVSGVLLTFIPISNAKRAQQAQRESEERYALAQRAANIGSWDWDMVTNELHWSEMIEPMFGFAQGDFAGTYQAFLDRVHPDDRKYVIDSVEAAVHEDKQYSVKHRIVLPDGNVRWVSETGEVYRDERGKPVRMVGVVQDITARKNAEDVLRESEYFNRTILDALQEGVVVYDRQLRIVNWSRILEKLTGISTWDALGKSAYEIFPHHKEDGFDKLIQKALDGEDVVSPESSFVYSSDGKRVRVHTKYMPHRRSEGEVIGVIEIINEVAGDNC